MTTAPSERTTPQRTEATTGRSLRYWGVLVLVMFLLTSAIGGSLALESSYLPVTLASHIGLALVTLGFAGYATSSVGRSYRAVPRASAGVAALAALGATIAGAAYLLASPSNSALYAMEGFAGVGILAALVMIGVGAPSGKRAPTGPSP
ncbi:MAG: hypothetical protein L3K02_03045 [Thermoplasmata archaeon]|nr:hypothetical protein [Thermoplasmata archaeon]